MSRKRINHDTNQIDSSHLRSSDMAEGIQCVLKMSTVAAFAFFVCRTTICTRKIIQTQFRKMHKFERRQKEKGIPADIPNQISKIQQCNSLPCWPSSLDSSQVGR